MMDPRVEMDPDHLAELEDRAAERVEHDVYRGVDRADRDRSRAEHHAEWVDSMTEWADKWERTKAASGHPCDYGWRRPDSSVWSDVL